MEQTRKWWRWGVNRWIILALIILSVFTAKEYWPIQPHIQLPAEPLTEPLFYFAGFPFRITNTLVATVLADIVLIFLAFKVRGGVKKAVKAGTMVVTGIAGALEALVEGLYNMTESTAGKWAKSIFPFFATITLLVLVANWMELIPGVDSIGLLEHPHSEGVHGFAVEEAELFGIPLGVDTLTKAEPEHGDEYVLVPFVRVASTDLNFTMAIALVSVVFTQVIGIRALGMGYFTKFFNTGTLFKVPIFGVIDFGVGLLELLSEFIK
ncbi:MAG: F0F1 ATP synthase subunit A, partial [Anaerolineae bacterium]|nr:F0F1 ATP synthase subunit A [Anaerolineae bacterium]